MITDQSLESDSVKVAAQSDFTFRFMVTNPVPEGGSIEINFPLTHFEVPKAQDLEIRQSLDEGHSWQTQDESFVEIN